VSKPTPDPTPPRDSGGPMTHRGRIRLVERPVMGPHLGEMPEVEIGPRLDGLDGLGHWEGRR